MDTHEILNTIWTAINTPVGITVMAGVFLWLLNRLYAAKPAWAAFEGAIISAVKFAEKQVPDGTPNKGLARLDAALKYVVKVYEETKGKKPSAKTVAELTEGIQVVHNDLEKAGALK
jgi:hypothetical protein